MTTLARDEALEQAIIDAPLDPAARMVYADWIQAAGDRRGEWMALHAAIEREPTNVRLRSLALDFLGTHTELLLGGGKRLLTASWIGWRGGFIDELRIQYGKADAAKCVAALLAHPSARFVRCIGLGRLQGRAHDVIAAIAAAAPPLLETVILGDGNEEAGLFGADPIAELPTVRRLGLRKMSITSPMPWLRELAIAQVPGWHYIEEWVEVGGCSELEHLTIDCRDHEDGYASMVLAALPKLRTLRLLHHKKVHHVIGRIANLRALELLDLSHSSVTDADLAPFVGRSGFRLVALRTNVSESMAARIADRGGSAVTSRRDGIESLRDDEEPAGGWLLHRLETDGREGLALMPGIGQPLYSIGTQHSDMKRAIAVTMLDTGLTLPSDDEDLMMWGWANAAITHEERLELDEAELLGREGLLRTPKEPNLYAVVLDALRRTGRNAQALALLPKALATITRKKGPGAHAEGPAACLADCMMCLAQAGRHREVLALSEKHAALLRNQHHVNATVAMSFVALGKPAEARSAIARATGDQQPGLIAHGKAVVALAAKKPDRVRVFEHLRACKEAKYPEWHWIPVDPNLAKLRDAPQFLKLIAP